MVKMLVMLVRFAFTNNRGDFFMSLTDIKAKMPNPWEGIQAYWWLWYVPSRYPEGFQILANGLPFWREAKTLLYWCLPCCFSFWRKTTPWWSQKASCSGHWPNAKKQAEVKELKAKRDKTRSFSVVAKAWFSTKTKWSKDYGDSVWKRLEICLPDNWR